VRIAFGELSQESDTFSPARQPLAGFEINGILEGDELLAMPTERVPGHGALGGFLSIAQRYGEACALVPLMKANGGAGPTISAECHAELEGKFMAHVRAAADAAPLDALFLSLHGAAAAEHEDDVEGALLEKVRGVVGDEIPIVVALDHHANITARMALHADALVGHETQPHHQFDTGSKAAALLFHALMQGARPTTVFRKLPMVTQQDQYLTASEPMGEWFRMARALERQPGVLDVSPYPMQPWLDVKEAGWAVVVTTDGDAARAESLAEEMCRWAWERREAFMVNERIPPPEAVAQALGAQSPLILLSDTGDSVYGGAPGDSTVILNELLRQGAAAAESDSDTGCILLPVVDPEVVAEATSGGVGAVLSVRLGARVDSVFSEPAELTAQVGALWGGTPSDKASIRHAVLPECALLVAGRLRIAVMAEPAGGVNHPHLYQSLGLAVEDARAVVMKTASNFQYFAEWEPEMVRVDTAGMTQSDLTNFEWHSAPRPIFPLDEGATF